MTLKQGGIDIEGVQSHPKGFMKDSIVCPCLVLQLDKLICASLSTRNLHEAGRVMASVSSRRLRKELSEIHAEGCPCGNIFCLNKVHLFTPHPGIKLLSADDFETWFFSIEVLGESLYQASTLCTPCSYLNSVPLGGGLQINVPL